MCVVILLISYQSLLFCSGKGFFSTNRDNGKTNEQGKDTAGLGDDINETEQKRKQQTERESARKREFRKRKRTAALSPGEDSDDDGGMFNYLNRLTNVIEKISTTEDSVVGNKIVKVQAAIGLQNNSDPIAAKMGTDYLMGILNSSD